MLVKVCLDIQPAIAQRAGVGRYTRELAKKLLCLRGDDDISFFCFDFSNMAWRADIPEILQQVRRFSLVPGRIMQASWRVLKWPPFNQLAGYADVYHFPNFTIPPLRRGRAVVTIHDASFMRHPECAEKANLSHLSKHIRSTVRRADAIITDSTFSADEIVSLLGADPARTHAIPLGVDKAFAPLPSDQTRPVLERLGITRPYLLTVGTIEPRKNIPFLISLFEALSDFDGMLVLAGMPGWNFDPILTRIRQSRRRDSILWLKYVADEDLPSLYSSAIIFLTASLYEGFGLPPLEAMACGTPVVSSSGGALREIAGPAAVIIENYDVDAWIVAIRTLLYDTSRRRVAIEKGLEYSRKFTWAETARLTWQVYRNLAR